MGSPDTSPPAPAQFEFARMTDHEGRTVAICPSCDARYDVTEVYGDMAYDRHPEVPGQQARCRKCEAVFTLPGT